MEVPVPDPTPAPLAEAPPAFADAPGPPISAQPLAAPVAPTPSGGQPMIAIADPVAAAAAGEPVAAKAGRKLPSLHLPRVSLPGNPLVALLVILLLAGGGWYAWKSMHGSSSTASPPAKPVATHAATKTATKPVHLPKSAPSDLAGIPWMVDPVTRSLAAHIAAGQKRGGHVVVASYYGQTLDDRFFFLASNVRAADRKPVSTAVAKARLASLSREISGGDPFKVTSFVTIKNAGSPPVSCATGNSGAGSDVTQVTVCSWQSPTARVVVAGRGTVAPTQLLLNRVLTQLSR